MAPSEVSAYLPPLDKCLEGGRQLLSWKLTFAALVDDSPTLGNRALGRFLMSGDTIEVLIQSLDPQRRPNAKSRSDFEAHTAAINLAPNGNDKYDTNQIKEDALWLSKHVELDEVSALRVVVLEWQARPAFRLLRNPPHDELPTIGGGSKLKSSLLGSISELSTKTGSRNSANDFDSERSRRLRLLNTYFSEAQFQWKTLEHILFRTVCESSFHSPAVSEGGAESEKSTSDKNYLISRAGELILKAWNVNGVRSSTGKNWLLDVSSLISQKLKAIETSSGLFLEEGGIEELEVSWCETNVVEIIHLMHITLILVQNTPKLSRSDSFSSWFQTMDDVAFFGYLELPFPSLDSIHTYHLRSLATLVSVALLKLNVAIEALPEMSSVSSTGQIDGKTAYLHNLQCVEKVTQVLLNAATNAALPAQPVSLAWSIILQNARAFANRSQETRELRQGQKAFDSMAVTQHSDTESNDSSSSRQRPTAARRTSFGSDTSQQLTFLEELIETVARVEQDEDVIGFLAKSAFQGPGVFNTMTDIALSFCTSFGSERNGKPAMKMRLLLLQLLNASLDYVDYHPELIQTTLAIISGGKSHWESKGPELSFRDSDPASVFLSDRTLMDRIYEVALSRFPYETVPYLRLCQVLAFAQPFDQPDKLAMAARLDALESFTSVLFEDETSYQLSDDDAGIIRLTSPLDPLASLQRTQFPNLQRIRGRSSKDFSDQPFVLPEGTAGRSLTDAKPHVVLFKFSYSALRYMGLVLQRTVAIRASSHSTLSESSLETTIEILRVLTALLRAAFSNPAEGMSRSDCQVAAQNVLESASDGLDRNNDIVSLIFNLFEDELYLGKSALTQEGSTDLLVCCMQFAQALLTVLPGRVWPFLGRSGMLGLDGLESRLGSVVATLEVTAGEFPVLTSAVHLLESLVEDTVIHAVSRKRTSSVITRYGAAAPDPNGAGVTDSAMKKIILHFVRIVIDVYESCDNWRFTSIEERLDINTTLCRTFESILRYCYDVDDNEDLSQKIASCLAPAAEYLLEVFLSEASNDLPIQPILQKFVEGLKTPSSTLTYKALLDWTLQTQAALKLACRLVRTNTFLNRAQCQLENQLFDSTPILVRVFATNQAYRLPVVQLMDALVRGASRGQGQPPSLLGHLGQVTSRCFLDMLSSLDEPLDNPGLSSAIWKLLSAIVSQRQQWFAIYLLTGTTPKASMRTKGSSILKSSHVHPVLDVAVKKLCHIEGLDPAEAVNILEFVALSADFWPWVCEGIQRNNDLIRSFTLFLTNLQPPEHSAHRSLQSSPYQIQMAAFISNILSIIVHRCNEVTDTDFVKRILPHLTYLVNNGVSTPIYNSSLHASLRKNFETRYSKFSLSNFKRTVLCQTELGLKFYYDTDFATKVLGHDPSWKAKGGQGFFDEFERANVNLSFVEAQMNLYHAWKSLAIELSVGLSYELNFQSSMAQVVRGCLICNQENTLPELIFKKLAQSRADLAFVLLQSLIDTPQGTKEALNILKPAWETLRTNAPDIGLGLTSSDAEYNRTLLKILYLALQAHISSRANAGSINGETKKSNSDILAVVLEILGTCVARGFRSLVTSLHEEVTKVSPADVALVNGILRTCLQIPDVDRYTEQLVAHFADDNTARYASTLLSWADQLAIDRDPIYGELSMMFLVDLSSIPALAEYIVTGGSLAQIGTANLMNYFRRPGGIGPFDEPTRMYGIWTRGVLPLILNVLGAIGAPIVADIAAFMNQFRGQLERASNSLDPKPNSSSSQPNAGYITLSLASEVHSLAMISSIVDMFREAGASAGINPLEVAPIAWDRAAVKADLESRLQRRITLRDDIAATDEQEESWLRQKPVSIDSGAEHRLEEKLVDELKAALALMVDVDQ